MKSTSRRLWQITGVIGFGVLVSQCSSRDTPGQALLALGQVCTTDSECESALCQALPGQTTATCIQTCQAGCSSSEQCEQLGSMANPRYACVPAASKLCQTCTGSSQCPYPADICYQDGTNAVCGEDCSYDGTCPLGFTCAQRTSLESSVAQKQCVPVSGTCTCTAVVDTVTSCGTINNVCTVANGTPECTPHCQCGVQSCDTGFADCDGGYADGCETNTNSDPNNCGACGHVCTFGDNQGGACVNGQCVVSGCATNYWNLHDAGCDYYCVYGGPGYDGGVVVDVPSLDFVDLNCDGIDGTIADAIFVDGVHGSDANPGTMAQPKKTLGASITAAQAVSKDVYASAAVYNEAVTMMDGVGIYGAYSAAGGWSRDAGNITTIQSPNAVGVSAQNLTQATEIQLFTVISASATGTQPTGDGLSSTGVLVVNSTGGFTVRGCSVTAGNGADGADGGDGVVGTNGGNGGGAGGASQANGGDGGVAGASACGSTGGAGAPGVNGPNVGLTGSQGGPNGSGAAGGSGGSAGVCQMFSNSLPGGNAPPVSSVANPGSPGSGGFPSASNYGSLDNAGDYLPVTGGDGNGDGTAGAGGGGGGSGGGNNIYDSNDTCVVCGTSFGSGGGGGGGGGGCGGAAAFGGRGGGGSFAVESVNSNVTLDRSPMATGNGGNGGHGGNGGLGGSGGAGGPGGNGTSGNDCGVSAASGAGAQGGAGARGGQGGGGAGGTGGPSVCIAFKGTEPANPGSLSTCAFGSPGNGGAGGNAAAPGTLGYAGAVSP
jgi:hypothetical protein